VILDHFVVVRIHARAASSVSTTYAIAVFTCQSCYPFVIRFSGSTPGVMRTSADNARRFSVGFEKTVWKNSLPEIVHAACAIRLLMLRVGPVNRPPDVAIGPVEDGMKSGCSMLSMDAWIGRIDSKRTGRSRMFFALPARAQDDALAEQIAAKRYHRVRVVQRARDLGVGSRRFSYSPSIPVLLTKAFNFEI